MHDRLPPSPTQPTSRLAPCCSRRRPPARRRRAAWRSLTSSRARTRAPTASSLGCSTSAGPPSLRWTTTASAGGGWTHDLLNDATYTRLLLNATKGEYDGIMVAFPCSTFALTRFFDASTEDNEDPGPPVIRTAEYPDGLPTDQLDPKHVTELQHSNLLLARTVNILGHAMYRVENQKNMTRDDSRPHTRTDAQPAQAHMCD